MAAKQSIHVGVDLGGTNVAAGALDGNGKLLGRAKAKTKPEKGVESVLERVVETIHAALADAKLDVADVAGIGIGAPGVMDFQKGVVTNAPNLRWRNVSVVAPLSKATGLPVTLDNDVNVGAWGEYAARASANAERVSSKDKGKSGDRTPAPMPDDMLAIFVGTGIGAGLILNGSIYHGHFFTAGEIGHTVVDPNGDLGRRTLENLASRTAVVNMIAQLVKANHPSVIMDLVAGDLSRIRSKSIAEALSKKDPLVREVVRASARLVGVAAANLVTTLSLPCVVIGGGLAEAVGQPYVDWVREAFDERVFPSELKACQLLLSQLGDDAGVVGAALLARTRLQGVG